jgi:hypothetical protein
MDLIEMAVDDNPKEKGMKELGDLVSIWADGASGQKDWSEVRQIFRRAIETKAPEEARRYKIIKAGSTLKGFYYESVHIKVQYFTSS